jgi:hypothetical protein
VAELGPISGGRRPADPAVFTAMLRDAPVDPGWREELLAEREAERASATDPWA